MDYRALIFVPALVGCVVFGFVFALFAANHYLTVLQSTGSGAKQVVWVSEPMVDNFWKVFYLGWLIGLWLGPAWLLGRAFATSVDQPWMRYAVPLSVFWICYPVSQLSSLSGPSIWLPLHYEVFARLARKPEMVISFLVVSGITLVGLGLSFHWTFNATGTVWLFIGAPLFIASALLYARLLGRVAFALMYTRSIFSRKKKKKPKAPNSDISSPAEIEPEAEEEFVQPSELPPIQTPDEGPLTGYNIDFEGAKPKPVPNVMTHSTPWPVMTPRPCTVASLSTRTGRPRRSWSTAPRS